MTHFVLSDFLYIGHTCAVFRRFGKVPSERDLFINILIGYVKSELNSFSRHVGILLGPDALLALNY